MTGVFGQQAATPIVSRPAATMLVFVFVVIFLRASKHADVRFRRSRAPCAATTGRCAGRILGAPSGRHDEIRATIGQVRQFGSTVMPGSSPATRVISGKPYSQVSRVGYLGKHTRPPATPTGFRIIARGWHEERMPTPGEHAAFSPTPTGLRRAPPISQSLLRSSPPNSATIPLG